MNSTHPGAGPISTASGPELALTRTGSGRLAQLLSFIALAVVVSACSFLKPAKSTARHYLLTPMPVGAQSSAAGPAMAVGVGQVKIPAYLFNTSMAVRKGTNEIEYLESARWAERLDTGFQRVLAANLAAILPTERIHLSAWQRDDVAAEVYVVIEQFDVDAGGLGVLVARWRVLSPGEDKVLKAGTCRLSRQGPPPEAGASGAIGTLSQLVADFSQRLAQALQEMTPSRVAAAPTGS